MQKFNLIAKIKKTVIEDEVNQKLKWIRLKNLY